MTRQLRSARTRHALIRSAAQSFDQLGYAQAKLATISAGAGVSTGALHFHFETKAAVAAAVEAEASRALCTLSQSVQRKNSQALQALIDATHVLARLLRQDVVVRAGFQLNCGALQRPELDLRRQWMDCVREMLGQAEAQGAVEPGSSLEGLAAMIVGVTVGFEVLARDDASWLSHESIAGLWRTLLPRLAATDTLGRWEPSGATVLTGGEGAGPAQAGERAIPTPQPQPQPQL
ncbi:ScbR family autoregulator-binding transcription factor [Streptomyces sp. NPDC091266]|uniref:ScbR family autoregulator-binding transcription factor n=1 Tax=Streptomyces sp. NPDC091266 TaxID=3365978 RepID=UPI003821563F